MEAVRSQRTAGRRLPSAPARRERTYLGRCLLRRSPAPPPRRVLWPRGAGPRGADGKVVVVHAVAAGAVPLVGGDERLTHESPGQLKVADMHGLHLDLHETVTFEHRHVPPRRVRYQFRQPAAQPPLSTADRSNPATPRPPESGRTKSWSTSPASRPPPEARAPWRSHGPPLFRHDEYRGPLDHPHVPFDRAPPGPRPQAGSRCNARPRTAGWPPR